MPKSRFTRFKEGVQISGVDLAIHQKGRVWYVCNSTVLAPLGASSPSDGNTGKSPESPLATVAKAISLASTNRGDLIVIGPGHVETLTNATALAINVAGLRIVGTGDGALKPTFTLATNATANIPISAANVSLKGIRVVASAASITAAITVTAANVELDVETMDTDSTHAMVTGLLTTAACSNLRAKLYHRGFAASTVGVRYVDLVGVVDADLDIDYFGKSSTSVVDMRTTACADIRVVGRFYNDSASLTKNVTDNATSTWSVDGFDARAGQLFSGSTNQAVAYNGIGQATLANQLAQPMSIASAAKTLTTGNVNMFTITGGPIKVLELVGIVTTVVQAQTTSTKVTCTTTSPAATVDFSAAAVDLTGAAAGASIRHINTTGILTVVTAGFVNEGNAFATNDTQYLVPAGTLQVNNASASNTGAITWYMRYVPLSPLSVVS